VNCLVGPSGTGFDTPTPIPAAKAGNGAIPDASAAQEGQAPDGADPGQCRLGLNRPRHRPEGLPPPPARPSDGREIGTFLRRRDGEPCGAFAALPARHHLAIGGLDQTRGPGVSNKGA